MERVLVSISRAGDREIDLDLPAEINAETLVKELALSLGWEDSLEVLVEHLGRVLGPGETLAQAGIRDGARLFLQPRGSPAVPPVSPPSSGSQLPLQGWRPLFQSADPAASPTPPPASPSPSSSGGFIWKQVDED